MPIFKNTLDELVEYTMTVPLSKDNWWAGTCTGGTTGTVVDTSRYEPDDFFQNLTPQARIRIRSTTDGAAPKGEERVVTDWVQSTGTASAHANFTAAPAAGDRYCIMSEYSWDEVVSAINLAIDAAAKTLIYFSTDQTMTFQASVYEYPVPTGFLYLFRISQADANGDYPDPVPSEQWKIIRGETPKIHLVRMPVEEMYTDIYSSELWADNSISDGREMRIEGLKRQERLTDVTDICHIDPNYVAWQAAAFLHASRIRRSDVEADAHQAQFNVCQAQADRFKAAAKVVLPPNCKKVYE